MAVVHLLLDSRADTSLADKVVLLPSTLLPIISLPHYHSFY
jgi:hypothetical protein